MITALPTDPTFLEQIQPMLRRMAWRKAQEANLWIQDDLAQVGLIAVWHALQHLQAEQAARTAGEQVVFCLRRAGWAMSAYLTAWRTDHFDSLEDYLTWSPEIADRASTSVLSSFQGRLALTRWLKKHLTKSQVLVLKSMFHIEMSETGGKATPPETMRKRLGLSLDAWNGKYYRALKKLRMLAERGEVPPC